MSYQEEDEEGPEILEEESPEEKFINALIAEGIIKVFPSRGFNDPRQIYYIKNYRMDTVVDEFSILKSPGIMQHLANLKSVPDIPIHDILGHLVERNLVLFSKRLHSNEIVAIAKYDMKSPILVEDIEKNGHLLKHLVKLYAFSMKQEESKQKEEFHDSSSEEEYVEEDPFSSEGLDTITAKYMVTASATTKPMPSMIERMSMMSIVKD